MLAESDSARATAQDSSNGTTLSVVQNLRTNKWCLQLILCLLSQWNELEIQSITSKQSLLADLTLLWTRLSDVDAQLESVWRTLIKQLSIELTSGWEIATNLRKQFEAALAPTLSHMTEEGFISEDHLQEAAQAAQYAEERALEAYEQPKSNTPQSAWFPEETTTRKLLSKAGRKKSEYNSDKFLAADLVHRQKLANLNNLRYQFRRKANTQYANIIDAQLGIASAVANCLTAHSVSHGNLACRISRCNSSITEAASQFSPSKLMAPVHDNLFRDLTSENYADKPYMDPRLGIARCRILVGVSLRDESDIKNSFLSILMASLVKRSPSILHEKELHLSEEKLHSEVTYLETHWSYLAEDNVATISRRSTTLVNSLLRYYLVHLPEPLLPITDQDFTQFVLKPRTMGSILRSVPSANLSLLRELCALLARDGKDDPRAARNLGKLIVRAKCSLMGDEGNEKSIGGLVSAMIRYFRKEQERRVLDISAPSID